MVRNEFHRAGNQNFCAASECFNAKNASHNENLQKYFSLVEPTFKRERNSINKIYPSLSEVL